MAKEKRAKGEPSAEKAKKKRKSVAASEVSELTGEEAPPAATDEPEDAAAEPGEGPPRKAFLSPIARPLAEDKLKKRALKLVKKAAKGKLLKRGVKEVVKALRKQQKGLCLIAGDISPIDVIAHLPVMCEDRSIPFVFVPSKEELGAAGQTKRPTSCVLVQREPAKAGAAADEDYQSTYDDVFKRVQAVQVVF